MTQSPLPAEVALSLAPLGAGDLIDRAIRLYRRHFFALLRIALFPVLVSALGSVCMTVGIRLTSAVGGPNAFLFSSLLIITGFLLWVGGMLFQVIVMGGATRNLVTHLLWNTPVRARTTYKNVKARLAGLFGAALLIGIAGVAVGFVALLIFYLGVFVLVLATFALVQVLPEWLYVIFVIIGATVTVLVCLIMFFFVMGHLAYVPQVMLVEGKDIIDAFGRSFRLARGHVFRLMGTVLFSLAASYSALMILFVPIGLYAYIVGFNPLTTAAPDVPVWYTIGSTVAGQISAIVVAPIWMLGLSLLYVDQRVRREGYDLEVMAERQLAAMPVYQNVSSVSYTPAVATGQSLQSSGDSGTSGSMLGLG